MTTVLALVMLVLVLPLKAQPPDTLWSQTFGGTNIDVGHAVQQTTDGGYIVTGYTRSFGSMSGRNVWLVKTDPSGNEEWNNAFGGNDDEEGYSIEQTSDGGYIIAGYTKSFGVGLNDVILIKTDSSGNSEWTKTFGGGQDDEGYSVQQTRDGGYVVAGVTSSHGTGSRDMWLIKTDSSGNQEWARTHGGFSSDGAWSAQQTSDGGFIITGWTLSHGPGFLGNAWLVKTDTSGIEEWNQVFGGDDVDRGYSVQQTTDGGYILTGYTSSSGSGLYDMLLIKTDDSGNEEWNKTFGGSGRDYGNSVQQTIDGGFIVAGYTLSFGAGGDDVWVVKTDSAGIEEWNNTYGGGSSDAGYDVKQTSDGGYIIVGHTLSSGAGLHDVWLIKVASDIIGIDEAQGVVSDYNMFQNYPNPFNPTTTIKYQLPQNDHIKLTIYNILGQRVRTLLDTRMEPGHHSIEWDGRDDDGNQVSSGIYGYQLTTKDFVQSRKMLLIR